MQNFYYDIPTKVFFGEGQIQNLPELVSEFGQCALLVYGGGSVSAVVCMIRLCRC